VFSLPPTDGIRGHLYVSQSIGCEMATMQKRARCVGWLFETESVTQTQQNYRTEFNKPWPPRSPDITQLDSFPVGLYQEQCVGIPVNGLDDLKTRIRNGISAIPADKLIWTFFVLPRDPTARSTRSIKNFQRFI
jgi:hypothetical protein